MLTGELTALVAVCDVVTASQRSEELRACGWPVDAATAEVSQLDGSIFCAVQEFGIRRKGVAVPLRRRLGWGSRSNAPDAGDQWRHLSLEAMTREVLNVVLPDDAEQSGDEHPWAEFVAGLRLAGVSASVQELRELPYNVLFAPRLYDILTGAAHAQPDGATS